MTRSETGRLQVASRVRVALAAMVCMLAVCAFGATSAQASSAWLRLSVTPQPTNLPPGGTAELMVAVTNLGDASLNGEESPLTIVDQLPSSLTVTAMSGKAGELERFSANGKVTCTPATVSCEWSDGTLLPYERIWIDITVAVAPEPSGSETNEVAVSGSGVSTVSLKRTLTVSPAPTAFGVESYEMMLEEEGGGADTQAGSHPFQLTTALTFNHTATAPWQPALPKDLHFELPPGLIGNPTPFPQCTAAEFGVHGEDALNRCPQNTVVGVAQATYDELHLFGLTNTTVPLFNLEPERGEPAKFGFSVLGTDVILDTSVRTGGDYGVTVSVDNIPQVVTLLESTVTFWGVPGDERHDNARGWYCPPMTGYRAKLGACGALKEAHPQPLLTLPTSCTGPLQSAVTADSWAAAGQYTTYGPGVPLPSMGGCDHLNFEPSISVAPDSEQASTPTGLTVDVHVPQDASLNPQGLAESAVKNTTVTLPAGLVLNPAAADGLQSCSEAQIGLSTDAQPSCPQASKLGAVEIKTPLLPNPLRGAAYLAAQEANPFGSLIALYVAAKDPVSGTLVKLAGEVKADPVTGQLVSTFKETPQLPFEDFELKFFGGGRASMATPARCGRYTTTAAIAPWSGGEAVGSSSAFGITAGQGLSVCANPLLFAPTLAAGTSNIQAGAFSPFTMTMSRPDGQQSLDAIKLQLPAGLSGMLSRVKLCGEPQANAGLCGAESEIGETTVSVGLGGDPYTVTGGKAFITGPYNGNGACTVGEAGCAPYGLSIVNPAKAGPFDLEKHTPCDCIVVRAKIEVDPHTTALTVTSDSSGPHAIPTILDGIPLQIKHVNVTVNRPGFMFNPTSCEKMLVAGDLRSAEGASAAVSLPFQVTNCASLPFKPGFEASTRAKHTRRKGAYLHVSMSSTEGEADIREVRVELPKALPSRLSTLQKACTEAVFAANPASCPAESIVGHAVVHTPLLPVALTGPAYFVSHGGAKFPELIMVLQGYGVTVELNGETFINKNGITSSTFKTIPDVPFTTFSLVLPTGSHSALAGNGNFCRKQLVMPLVMVGQNGKRLEHDVKLSKQGCKPEIYVLKRKVKDSHASLVVHVPAAGKLVASGKGIKRTVSKIGKAGRVQLNLHLRRQARAMLAKHAHRKLKVRLGLRFEPKHKQHEHARSMKAHVSLLLG